MDGHENANFQAVKPARKRERILFTEGEIRNSAAPGERELSGVGQTICYCRLPAVGDQPRAGNSRITGAQGP